MSKRDDEESLEGHYAGAVTRLAAAVADGAISFAIFVLGTELIRWLADAIIQRQLPERGSSWLWLIPMTIWEFTYYWYCFTLSGKTPGCALLGIRVVRDTGDDLNGLHAAVRVIAFPLSFLFFGIGFLGIVLGRERRALHDVIAGTAVVYDWDARAARLRFLARHASAERSGTS